MPSRQTAAPARPEHVAAALRGLLSYMSRTRFALIAVAVLVCVSGGANLLGTYMIKPVVNAIEDGDPQRFLAGVAFTAGIYLTGVVACFGYSQIMVRVAQKVVSDIRRDLFARIERLPLSFFDRTRHGDVMSCFTNDVDTVSEALNNSFANLVQAGVQIVGTGTEVEVYGPPLPSDMAKSISAQPSSIVVRMEESTEPTPAPIYVYCNTGGKNYHSQDCKYVYEHTPRVTLLEAVKASYTKCPYCNAPDASAIFD